MPWPCCHRGIEASHLKLRVPGLLIITSLLAVQAMQIVPEDNTQWVIAVDLEGQADKQPISALSRSLVMTDAQGRQFDCSIPEMQNGSLGAGMSSHTQVRLSMAPLHARCCACALLATLADPFQLSDTMVSQLATPSALLDSLDAVCLYRIEDWWTFELCYKKHVRQFHREQDRVASEYLLGTYDEAASEPDAIQSGDATGTRASRYASHSYTGGEPCDLTGQPRSTEMQSSQECYALILEQLLLVRYMCSEDGVDAITTILEPFTCSYLMTVATPRLCKHPEFGPEQGRIARIHCRLLDTKPP